MAIRCASKAIILGNGSVLLNRCKREEGSIYYDLPGGDYTHRILHIFMASLIGDKKDMPTEKDFGMEESVWVPLSNIDSIPETRPSCLKQLLCNILETDTPLYFGTEYKDGY